MALFKTADEKAQIAAEKEQKMLDKFGLGNLRNQDDINSVRKIVQELSGTGFMEFGATLGGGGEQKAQMYYQRAMLEQNFIIIRQLDRIATMLESK